MAGANRKALKASWKNGARHDEGGGARRRHESNHQGAGRKKRFWGLGGRRQKGVVVGRQSLEDGMRVFLEGACAHALLLLSAASSFSRSACAPVGRESSRGVCVLVVGTERKPQRCGCAPPPFSPFVTRQPTPPCRPPHPPNVHTTHSARHFTSSERTNTAAKLRSPPPPPRGVAPGDDADSTVTPLPWRDGAVAPPSSSASSSITVAQMSLNEGMRRLPPPDGRLDGLFRGGAGDDDAERAAHA